MGHYLKKISKCNSENTSWNILQKSMQFKKVLYGVEDKVKLSTSSVISMGLKSRALKVRTFKDGNRARSKLSRGGQQPSCQLCWK